MEVKACPVCHGQGTVSKPPYIDGDVHIWMDNITGGYQCKVCGGQGYLSFVTTFVHSDV
jgi:hypothetical protein